MCVSSEQGREGVSEIRRGGQMCVLSGDVATLQINRCQATGENTLTRTNLPSFTVIPAGKELQMQVMLQKLLL